MNEQWAIEQIILNKKNREDLQELEEDLENMFRLNTAGDGVDIDSDGKISVKLGEGLKFDELGKIATNRAWGFDLATTRAGTTITQFVGELDGMTAAEREAFIDNYLSVVITSAGDEVDGLTLRKNDWTTTTGGTASNIAAAAGDVMVKFDKLYTLHKTRIIEGVKYNSFRAYEEPFENASAKAHKFGGVDCEAVYRGAFEGTLNASNALCSVYSTTATPANTKTIDAFRALTGSTYKSGTRYGLDNVHSRTLYNDLFLCVYGNRNSQAAVGKGITELTAAQPVGVAAILSSGMTYGTTANGETHCKALHTVNPWGNVWEFCDGFAMINSKIYINPDNANNIALYPSNVDITEAQLNNAGYDYIGNMVAETPGGFAAEMGWNDDAPYIANHSGAAAASSETYWADKVWFANTDARVALCGGGWADAAGAGAFFLYCLYAPSAFSSAVGARLLMHSKK